MFGAQSPEERECRRESENPGPADAWHLIIRFYPFDESKYNTQKRVCQVFCQIIFLCKQSSGFCLRYWTYGYLTINLVKY